MADLRGEQLKDSYQNVVTRGTGNKLENGNGVEFADLDDKASLSGGEDANFSAMPQVGGNPIVERDSNDDGEWVRIVGNIQICTRRVSHDLSNQNIQSWDFPVSFTSTPKGSFGANVGTASSLETFANRGSAQATSTTQWRSRHRDSGSGTIGLDLTAIGPWQ